MKRIFATVLVLILVLTMFVGCKDMYSNTRYRDPADSLTDPTISGTTPTNRSTTPTVSSTTPTTNGRNSGRP
ncbi:MAG: hypothetical protein LBM28_03215 [Oscillospiraceae bacterium]|jgi:hypothetical protein|nr:hypothetical protein [Oscillospiraceae bacterium]